MSSSGNSQKQWALLTYMAGDNNLTEEMVWGLEQMRKTLRSGKIKSKVKVAEKVGVIAQFDARGLNPRIYHLNRDRTSVTASTPDSGQDGLLDGTASDEPLHDLTKSIDPSPEQVAVARLHCRAELRYGLEALETALDRDAKSLVLTVLTKAVELERAGAADADAQLRDCVEKLIRAIRPETDIASLDEVINSLIAVARAPGTREEEELAKLMSRAPGVVVQTLQSQTCEQLLKRQLEASRDFNAQRCAVVFSGHAMGVVGEFLPDTDPAGSLGVTDLGRIMDSLCAQYRSQTDDPAAKIDILGLDSCLMCMAEVCCEVAGAAKYLIGSEGFVANTGWPYHRVIEALAAFKEPEQAARAIARKYARFYRDYELGGCSTQIAVVNLGRFENLLPELKELTRGILGAIDGAKPVDYWGGRSAGAPLSLLDAIVLAHWNSQTFKMGQYVDLFDFCTQLVRLLPDAEPFTQVRESLRKVLDGITGEGSGAVLESYYCGADFQHAHGLSIYFPWALEDLEPAYKNLRFERATGWFGLIEKVLMLTQRERRGQNKLYMKKGGGPKRPFRHRSDTEAMLESLGLDAPRRMGIGSAARAGIIGDSRSGFTGAIRSGFTGDARMQASGKAGAVHFQNPPTGYFRQEVPDPMKPDEQSGGFFGNT
jgi:hypothetical protein